MMDQTKKFQLKILNIYSKKIFLQKNEDFNLENKENIRVNFDLSVTPVHAHDNIYKTEVCFIWNEVDAPAHVEIIQAGEFEITGVDDNYLGKILVANCGAIIFPFIREKVSSLTKDANLPPLFLQPMNFIQYYEDNKNNIQENLKNLKNIRS